MLAGAGLALLGGRRDLGWMPRGNGGRRPGRCNRTLRWSRAIESQRVNFQQLETDIRGFVRRAYPNIEVRVEPWADDPTRPAVYFTEAQFAVALPGAALPLPPPPDPRRLLRAPPEGHRVVRARPGERPDDLEYPDAELIADITPDVMRALFGARVFEALDDLLCPGTLTVPGRNVTGTIVTRARSSWPEGSARTSCSTSFTSSWRAVATATARSSTMRSRRAGSRPNTGGLGRRRPTVRSAWRPAGVALSWADESHQ